MGKFTTVNMVVWVLDLKFRPAGPKEHNSLEHFPKYQL